MSTLTTICIQNNKNRLYSEIAWNMDQSQTPLDESLFKESGRFTIGDGKKPRALIGLDEFAN